MTSGINDKGDEAIRCIEWLLNGSEQGMPTCLTVPQAKAVRSWLESVQSANGTIGNVMVPGRFLTDFLKALDFHDGHGTPSFDRVYAELLAQEARSLLLSTAANSAPVSHGVQSELAQELRLAMTKWEVEFPVLRVSTLRAAVDKAAGALSSTPPNRSEYYEFLEETSAPPSQPAAGPTPFDRVINLIEAINADRYGKPLIAALHLCNDLAGEGYEARRELAAARSATPQSQWSTPDGWKLVCEKCGSGLQEPCGWPNNCEAEAPPRPVEKGAEP